MVPLVRDLLPLILEKWAEIHDRPLLREMEEELLYLQMEQRRFRFRFGFVCIFAILLLLWNIFLSALLIMDSGGLAQIWEAFLTGE